MYGWNWKEKLLQDISPSSLPEAYGGEVKDSDMSHFSWGGKIPQEFYKENDDTLMHQQIKPGKNFTIQVQVDKPGKELSWIFVTENYDIGFSVRFTDLNSATGNSIEVVPSERVSAHLGHIEGSIICDKAGTYVLHWDNSFSWTRLKNLKYKYTLN